VTRRNDDELRDGFKEAIRLIHRVDRDDPTAWAETIQAIEQLEKDHPDLRDHEFMIERLTDTFVSQLRKLGKPTRYGHEGYMGRIAKFVLLFEKPLLAAQGLGIILDSVDDPTEELEDVIRMAEVNLHAKFERITGEQAREEDFQRMVQIAAEAGHHLQVFAARKEFDGMRQQAEDLRATGRKGKDLIEYVCTEFLQIIMNRRLMMRGEA
jgi:hypothetical protein